jgi:hypothetical protein
VYETGLKVTDAQIDALPLCQHRFHGDWNYTLHPYHSHSTSPGAATTGTETIGFDRESLRNPELTGMTHQQFDTLISELTPVLTDQRELSRRYNRGGERLRAAGAGASDKLAPADRILATVPYLRKLGTHELFGQLFAVHSSTITRAVNQVRPLLEEHVRHVLASTARFLTPADVTAFLASQATCTAHSKGISVS